MIIKMSDMLVKAKKEGYGVPAPNVFNFESIEACYMAALELRAPVILDVAGVHGIYECADIARFFEKKYPEVPVALNLDHGGPFDDIVNAIRAGFSSVMVDRSTSPLEENIAETKEIVKIAHACNVSVEAELGHVGQGYEYHNTRTSGLTRLDEAQRFVQETNVDCLAVSVGTSHGVYQGPCEIDFKLLKELDSMLELPLVLHGGSGSGDDNLEKCIEYGIQKVNLNTDLVYAGQDKMMEAFKNDFMMEVPTGVKEDEFISKRMNLQQLFKLGGKGYQEKLMYYMRLFKSENRW